MSELWRRWCCLHGSVGCRAHRGRSLNYIKQARVVPSSAVFFSFFISLFLSFVLSLLICIHVLALSCTFTHGTPCRRSLFLSETVSWLFWAHFRMDSAYMSNSSPTTFRPEEGKLFVFFSFVQFIFHAFLIDPCYLPPSVDPVVLVLELYMVQLCVCLFVFNILHSFWYNCWPCVVLIRLMWRLGCVF